MIRARLSLDAAGCIAAFTASGHAGCAARGNDLVCAAFSTLARTAYRSLEQLPGIEIRGRAEKPGSLDFVVTSPAEDGSRARGVADFFVVGLTDVARDFPDAVVVEIERISEG